MNYRTVEIRVPVFALRAIRKNVLRVLILIGLVIAGRVIALIFPEYLWYAAFGCGMAFAMLCDAMWGAP